MLANRQNNSALMSESDHDDDLDQNLSTNQQNEVGALSCAAYFENSDISIVSHTEKSLFIAYSNSVDFLTYRV